MADFSLYYPKLCKYEGGYASDSYAAKMGDSGGETYRGIARNYNKNWAGWKIIDSIKAQREIKYNEVIMDPELYKLCLEHSKKAYWDKMSLDHVKNQSVAECIGDYGFNSGINYVMGVVQEIIGTPKTKVFNSNDIGEINLENQLVLFTTVQDHRVKMIINSTKINPKFKAGLIARAKSFTFKKQS
jgi:lysozyme family protein